MSALARQALDQVLHFLLAAAPVWLSWALAGVPWFGLAVLAPIVWGEWRQFPPRAWWDLALDGLFYAAGFAVALAWPLHVA